MYILSPSRQKTSAKMAMESHFNPILDTTMSSKTFRLSISLPLIILSTPKYPSTQLSTSDGESAEYKKEEEKFNDNLLKLIEMLKRAILFKMMKLGKKNWYSVIRLIHKKIHYTTHIRVWKNFILLENSISFGKLLTNGISHILIHYFSIVGCIFRWSHVRYLLHISQLMPLHTQILCIKSIHHALDSTILAHSHLRLSEGTLVVSMQVP